MTKKYSGVNMAYKTLSFDKRVAEDVKDYDFVTLFKTDVVASYLKEMTELLNIDVLLTDSKGNEILSFGDFGSFPKDVIADPGRKIKVKDRPVAHMYCKGGDEDASKAAALNSLMNETANLMCFIARQTYLCTESAIYIDELEAELKAADQRRSRLEKIDPLTGVFNTTYFNKRMDIIDRSEIAPVAVIEANINDWKYANDNFGDEGSDKLIRIIADVLKKEAKPEYVIGRIDGDVFAIVIPMPEDDEAEEYVKRIQTACDTYDDRCLTPSIACGLVYKSNVEETIADKISDAEYLMFENKFEIKNSPEYQARLHRGE